MFILKQRTTQKVSLESQRAPGKIIVDLAIEKHISQRECLNFVLCRNESHNYKAFEWLKIYSDIHNSMFAVDPVKQKIYDHMFFKDIDNVRQTKNSILCLLKVSFLCLVIIHAEPEALHLWVCNVFSMFSEGLAYWKKVTLFVLQYE